MLNLARKNELIAEFLEGVKENVKANLADLELKRFADSGDIDIVREAVIKIRANIITAIPYGYEIPKASLYTSGTCRSGSAITTLSITLTNSWKSDRDFKFSVTFNISDEIVEQVTNFFITAYEQLLLDLLVCENLEEINKLYDELTKEAGVDYKIKVVSPLNKGNKKIAFISDDEIDFVADSEKVFDVDDIMVFQEIDEQFTEERIAEAKKPLIDEIGLAQTTVQFAGIRGGALIKYLCNIGSQVKAFTLIKKVNSKNAKRLTGKKDTVAYFEKDGVYAIVARRDGNFEVILKPFDVETLNTVDLDVLAELTV